jgi:hypothetical protein
MVLALCLATATATATPTLHWSSGRVAGAGMLIGVACGSPTLCVGVSDAGKVVVSRDPRSGARTWKVVNGLTVLQTGGTPQAQLAAAQLDNEAYDVACPSQRLCLIGRPGGVPAPGDSENLDQEAIVYSTDPSAQSSSWHTETGIGSGAGEVASISCLSVHRCFALETDTDQYGGAYTTPLTSADPTVASSWKVVGPSITDDFQGLACPSTTLCVGGGQSGLWWSPSASGPMAPWDEVHSALTEQQIDSVACVSVELCIASPDSGNHDLVSTDPTAGTWRKASFDTGALTCTSEGLCIGSGEIGEVESTTDPGVDHAWQTTRVKGLAPNYLLAVSCASSSFCAGVGPDGAVAVGQSR